MSKRNKEKMGNNRPKIELVESRLKGRM